MSFINRIIPAASMALVFTTSCNNATTPEESGFDYTVDRFADIEVLRYQVPGFEQLSLDQKKLIYHLTEAAITGRDILWDQNCRYNLPIRQMLEAVYTSYDGDRDDSQFKAFEKYLKHSQTAYTITIRWTNSHRNSLRSFLPQRSTNCLPTFSRRIARCFSKSYSIRRLWPNGSIRRKVPIS